MRCEGSRFEAGNGPREDQRARDRVGHLKFDNIDVGELGEQPLKGRVGVIEALLGE